MLLSPHIKHVSHQHVQRLSICRRDAVKMLQYLASTELSVAHRGHFPGLRVLITSSSSSVIYFYFSNTPLLMHYDLIQTFSRCGVRDNGRIAKRQKSNNPYIGWNIQYFFDLFFIKCPYPAGSESLFNRTGSNYHWRLSHEFLILCRL